MSVPYGNPCKRCKTEQATVLSRKETFCNDCFLKFVSLKQRKQMMSDEYYQEIFKISYPDKIRNQAEADLRNEQSTVLIPLSLGSSSLAVLDIINDNLTEQKTTHRGKTGFQIDVVTMYLHEDLKGIKTNISKLVQRYSENSDKMQFHLVDMNNFYDSKDLKKISVSVENYATCSQKVTGNFKIDDLLALTPDKTSKEDLLSIITTHLIKKFALQHNYKAILWGHSMTRLADEIISLTVKGRGSQIASSIDNSIHDEEYKKAFKNLHPARDVLLSELDAYCHIKDLSQFCYKYSIQDTLLLNKFPHKQINKVKMVKSMTMNELARQYFDNIEGDYSNIISTVVRTGAKLSNPKMELSNDTRCEICNSIIYKESSKWLQGITVNQAFPIQNEEEQKNYEASFSS